MCKGNGHKNIWGPVLVNGPVFECNVYEKIMQNVKLALGPNSVLCICNFLSGKDDMNISELLERQSDSRLTRNRKLLWRYSHEIIDEVVRAGTVAGTCM